MKLPSLVEVCRYCKGAGRTMQHYTLGCGMGDVQMMGDCPVCEGDCYVGRDTGKRLPSSVLNQIQVAKEREDA